MIFLDFIRHARTQWNIDKKLQGNTDIDLCHEGVKDAERWAADLTDFKYDRIISSPLKRAVKTAEIIALKNQDLVEIESDFREQDFGQWEGQNLKSLRKKYPGQIEKQEAEGWNFCPPNGEPRKRVLKRVIKGISRLDRLYEGEKILVVSHSSVMKILIYHILGKDFLPAEQPGYKNLLKPYHLHQMVWDGVTLKFDSKGLNALDLNYNS